ncbi:hypothetical protein [uncultured Brevundimonas sp.]|uniref:hypothetical protein n=1 Tax=uncultured Brevundimonas sp. TaxID=213418 RepID=UPI0025EE03E0|nr:hypothetical protein [uncultured Brevundimonas sp.]
MSTFLMRQRLEAESASLQNLIDHTSQNDILGRVSLDARLQGVRKELEKLGRQMGTRAEIALVFNGAPVAGAAAIEASFGSKAIDAFQRTVATAFAVQASDGRVGQRGPTVSSEMAALHITGVVHGSFGFVLEELDPKGEQWTDSALKTAADATVRLLERVSAPDEAEAEAALEEVNDRLFVNIRDFVKLVHDHHATLTIAEKDRVLELNSPALARAYERVANATIVDEELTLNGILQGILPGARRFEFRGGGFEIKGKVARDISEEYLRSLESDPMVGHEITGVFRRRTVRDTTSAVRETYVLVRVIPENGMPSHAL